MTRRIRQIPDGFVIKMYVVRALLFVVVVGGRLGGGLVFLAQPPGGLTGATHRYRWRHCSLVGSTRVTRIVQTFQLFGVV